MAADAPLSPIARQCPACEGSGFCSDVVCCGASEEGCCGNPVAQEGPCSPCGGRGRMEAAEFLNYALLRRDLCLLAQHEAMAMLESLGPGALRRAAPTSRL